MMSVGDEHLMPRISNILVDEENSREELEGLLDSICAEMMSKSVDVSKTALRSCHTIASNNNFAGRYVTKVVSLFPLEVSKRFVWPHLTHDGLYQPSGRLILRKLFNIDHTDNTLLVITPTATLSRSMNKYIVHCYTVDTQWHLGASNLINNETALLKQALGPDSLSIIFCSSYINLEDAYTSSPIKGQVFQMLKMQCKAPVLTWYRGRCISLHMWSNESQDMDIVIEPESRTCDSLNCLRRSLQRVRGGRLPTGGQLKKRDNVVGTGAGARQMPPKIPKGLQLADTMLKSSQLKSNLTEPSPKKNPKLAKGKNNTVKNSHWRLPVSTRACHSLAAVVKSRR